MYTSIGSHVTKNTQDEVNKKWHTLTLTFIGFLTINESRKESIAVKHCSPEIRLTDLILNTTSKPYILFRHHSLDDTEAFDSSERYKTRSDTPKRRSINDSPLIMQPHSAIFFFFLCVTSNVSQSLSDAVIRLDVCQTQLTLCSTCVCYSAAKPCK
jgi:hypothetical protein